MKKRWLALGAVTTYLGLPYLLVQWANLSLIRQGRQSRRELALTFDDGPDPDTTPAVLDALKAAGVQATFFVLAPRAEAHPEVMARMLADGHEVAAHAVRHVHAWLRTPWGGLLDPLRATRRIQAVTGLPLRYHRPPHGGYSLATVLGQRLAGVQAAHWNVEGHDWVAALSPEQVRERVLRQLVPGSVIVLHDAGPGARNTVPLLPELLAEVRARGYQFRLISELDRIGPVTGRDVLRRAFVAFDRLYDRLGHVLPTAGRADNLYRTGRVAFPLNGIQLQDGTPVPQGLPATEFHANNALMVDLGPRGTIAQSRRDLRAVARDMQERPDLQGTEVIFCLSAVTPMLRALGFETHDLNDADTRRLRRWAAVLRWGYGSASAAPPPKLSILSRAAFLARYGAPEARDTAETG